MHTKLLREARSLISFEVVRHASISSCEIVRTYCTFMGKGGNAKVLIGLCRKLGERVDFAPWPGKCSSIAVLTCSHVYLNTCAFVWGDSIIVCLKGR